MLAQARWDEVPDTIRLAIGSRDAYGFDRLRVSSRECGCDALACIVPEDLEFSMARLDSIMSRDFTKEDIERFPVWVWGDDQDDNQRNPIWPPTLDDADWGADFVAAEFLVAGHRLEGYVVGAPRSPYAYTVFIGDASVAFNVALSRPGDTDYEYGRKAMATVAATLGVPEFRPFPIAYRLKVLDPEGKIVEGVIGADL